MPVTLEGIVMLSSALHSSNNPSSIYVNVHGSVMVFRFLQLSKALSSMLVTLFGIVTFVRFSQLLNASCPILVTPFLIFTFFTLSFGQGTKILFSISISPVPLIVNVPLLSNVQVRLSPHVPLSAMATPVISNTVRRIPIICITYFFILKALSFHVASIAQKKHYTLY